MPGDCFCSSNGIPCYVEPQFGCRCKKKCTNVNGVTLFDKTKLRQQRKRTLDSYNKQQAPGPDGKVDTDHISSPSKRERATGNSAVFRGRQQHSQETGGDFSVFPFVVNQSSTFPEVQSAAPLGLFASCLGPRVQFRDTLEPAAAESLEHTPCFHLPDMVPDTAQPLDPSTAMEVESKALAPTSIDEDALPLTHEVQNLVPPPSAPEQSGAGSMVLSTSRSDPDTASAAVTLQLHCLDF